MVSWSSEKTTNYLLPEKTNYIIKDNKASDASWCRSFDYPAKLNVDNEFDGIPGFISCFRCMSTQVYNNSNGTKRFKQYTDKCFSLLSITISSSSVTLVLSSTLSSQATLNQLRYTRKN